MRALAPRRMEKGKGRYDMLMGYPISVAPETRTNLRSRAKAEHRWALRYGRRFDRLFPLPDRRKRVQNRGDRVKSIRLGEKAVGVAMTAATATAMYLLYVRPWQLRWGATDEEVARPMPGDEIVERPTFDATRAVTIWARPEEIWPWIVQIGVTRAGWYSYDLLDNLGRPSVRRILPQFQTPEIGDVIPMSPDGKQGLLVKDFERGRWMLWWDGKGGMSWAWELYPVDEAHTRLITRVRLRYKWLSPVILFDMLVEFTDIVMMRKCMLGIKERAERGMATRTANRAQGGGE